MSKPKVYVHRVGSFYPIYMDGANGRLLESFAEVVSDGPREEPLKEAEVIKRMKGCRAILSINGWGAADVTLGALKAVGTVEVICISHWWNQFIEVVKETDIKVVEGSNANTVAVAEWTLAAALMGIRRLHVFDRMLKSGSRWGEPMYVFDKGVEKGPQWAQPRYQVGMICESVVGLIGLGRIGWYAAHYFRQMGAEVIAYDKYYTEERAAEIGVRLVPLEELLKTADVVSLHLPVTDETKGMLGAEEFALIKDGAVFINSARAALYDEEALTAELKKKRFTAYLDVFGREPLAMDHPFRRMDNVIITPHIAGSNGAMFLRCGREAVETLRDYFAGKGLRDLQYAYP